MASKRSVWLTGILIGIVSSVFATGLDAWTGGARLRPSGQVIVDRHLAPDLDGIVKIKATFRNLGIRPGGVGRVETLGIYADQGRLAITDRHEKTERALPLSTATHTLDLVLRRDNGPIEMLLRLTYFDNENDFAFERTLKIKCGDKHAPCVIVSI
jgi:hypothetical protein